MRPKATLTLPLRVPDPIGDLMLDPMNLRLADADVEWTEYRMVAFTARRRWPCGRWKMRAQFEEVGP